MGELPFEQGGPDVERDVGLIQAEDEEDHREDPEGACDPQRGFAYHGRYEEGGRMEAGWSRRRRTTVPPFIKT
jgi:hypothetical protein